MKKIISLSLFVFGVCFATQAQILTYRVDNGSATYTWRVEIDAGYPALTPTNIDPLKTIKGERDIKSLPVTWTAYKLVGSTAVCTAVGTFAGAMPLTNATVACAPGYSATAQYMVTSNPPILDLYVRLN